MRVLIATQYFPPEITAAAGRLRSFASGLARRGHEVEVICEVPNHPAGVVQSGYGGKLVDRRSMDGYEVDYVWVHATPSKSTRARLSNYASYMVSGTLTGVRRPRPEVVLASSPPLPVGVVGAAVAARHRVPWVLDVRDLWPDVAVAVEQVPDGRLVDVARGLERRLYRSATAITVTTESFKRAIEGRGGDGKVELLRNGASEEFLAAGAEEPDRRGRLDDEGRFTWTYAGNLGLAQGLETAIEAAALLGDRFRLLLVGEGPRREELRDLARRVAPESVAFRDPVPGPDAARILRASDALLVSLGASPDLEGFVPSKLFDCCAVGRPVLLSAAGEAAALAADAEAALCVPPGDPEAIAGAVRKLAGDDGLREKLAARARVFAEEHSRERGAEALERLLSAIVEDRAT